MTTIEKTDVISYTFESGEKITVARNATRETRSAREFFYRLAATMNNNGFDMTNREAAKDGKIIYYLSSIEPTFVIYCHGDVMNDFNSNGIVALTVSDRYDVINA